MALAVFVVLQFGGWLVLDALQRMVSMPARVALPLYIAVPGSDWRTHRVSVAKYRLGAPTAVGDHGEGDDEDARAR